ncbi:MAG: iron ABC transporter permease [Candidatus Omnitrophota bacterium]|jgi:ABC-type Fe3+ transport system permease subunit|nr:MAG: iron ABC transporter permease [Candidatus Omnitrophota bacterium]
MRKNHADWMVRSAIWLVLGLPLAASLWAFLPADMEALRQTSRAFDFHAWQRFWNSVRIGVWAAFFSLLFALPVFVLYVHLPLSVRRWLMPLSLLPLSYPPYGVASAWMTWIALWEQGNRGRIMWAEGGITADFLYTLPGAGFILGLCYWPIVFLLLTLTSRLSRAQHDSARIYLQGRTQFRFVFFPAWKEPIAVAASIIFCLGMVQFETPSLLQISVYPLEIFIRFSALLNEDQALFLCIVYLPILITLAWGISRIVRLIQSKGGEELMFHSLRIRWFAVTGTGIIFVLSVLIPLFGLLSHAGSVEFTLQIVSRHMPRILRSLFLCGMGAFLTVSAGFLFVSFGRSKRNMVHLSLILLLFVMPGVMIAAGWLYLRSLWPGALPEAMSVVTLLLAYTSHFFVLGYLTGLLLWRYYGKSQKEHDSLLRLTFAEKCRLLYWPNFRLPFLQATALVSLFLWGDVGITVLLHPAGWDTLAVEYFNLLHYGSEPRTAVIGLMLMGLPAIGMLLLLMTIRKKRTTNS